MAKVLHGPRLVHKLKALRTKIPRKVAQGVVRAAQFLLEKSQEIVPVDTGELKESGHIETTKNSAAVVYEAEHAVIVHEDLDARHEPPTQAKYVEEPLRIYENKLKDIIRETAGR